MKWSFSLVLFSLCFLGCRPEPYADLARELNATVSRKGEAFVLTSAEHTLAITPGKRPITIDGIQYYLHKEAGRRNLAAVDKRYLLAALKPLPARPLTIVLDPGHGGKDSGCRHEALQEQQMTLAIAQALKPLLEAQGHTVYLTRVDEKTTLTLDQRTQFAAAYPADLFLAIHVNATANPEAHGIETYTLPAPGTHGTLANSPPRPLLVGHAQLEASSRFALALHRAMLTLNPSDRGVRHAHFKVLRDTPAPAVLVEVGFITSAHDRPLLAQTQAIAHTLAQAFCP